MEENINKSIDYRLVWKKIKERKRLFYKTLPTAFIIACIYSLSIPRYYTTETKLAPEMDSSIPGGALGSIASSFGFDLSDMQTSDAITPLLYPDLMEDDGFVSHMFNIKVVNKDGTISTTYKDFLTKYKKTEWWNQAISFVKKLFKKKEEKNHSDFDPYNMSKSDSEVAEAIRNDVTFKADKKTGVITIRVQTQDPLICKTVADSTRSYLQQFITNYRTNKARTDYNYFKGLANEAKHDYERTRQIYANLADANTKVALKSVEMKMEDMENDLQLKFNAYSTLNTQLQASKAKVQERTPAFTVIKGASVPVRHTGPKRMLIVLLFLILTFIGTSAYILKDIVSGPKPEESK